LKYDRILACGGSWMVKKDLIQAGNFDRIQDLTRQAAGIVAEVRG
ncbi:MAG: 2-dehydro-3-deoxyphosphogluconate aldolase, partial [Lachnospiraceae bacterium]|nr:2-dehydro-3-deoxyphosphogluconate aldolase [Lachnospiraceae bacterium]